MRVLITGPQGSGKTTQAKLLAEFLDVGMISMGEMMRKRSEIDDELGRKIRQDLAEGKLVDDEVIAKAAKEEVEKSRNNFVMDGYPRSLHQMELYDPNFDKVVYLEIPDEEIQERLLKRARADDTPELIKERLNIYHNMTKPLLDHYKNQGILKILNGVGSIDEIQGEIRKYLNEA